jgi:hypothetical protein
VLSEASAAALSSKVTVTFGDTNQDLGNGNGSKLYKGTIALTSSCTLQEAYQYLQYLTRENSAATLGSIPGWRYRVLNAAYTEIPSAPFGTFAGGTFFVAQGWWLTGVLPGESTKYQLIAHDGTTQVPPTLIGITVGNLVAGDRVLAARENGSGGILKDEYTPVAASSGATSLQVVESIKTDTPTSGVIRIKNLRYTYSIVPGVDGRCIKRLSIIIFSKIRLNPNRDGTQKNGSSSLSQLTHLCEQKQKQNLVPPDSVPSG